MADDLETINFVADNIRIVTALQGIIEPFTNIYDIRLDYLTKTGLSLSDIHNLEVNETVINLCSKEYSKNIKCPKMIDIVFVEEDGKEKATYQKVNRGKMLDYLVKQKSTSLEVIKNFKSSDYSYCPSMSSELCYVFKRNA